MMGWKSMGYLFVLVTLTYFANAAEPRIPEPIQQRMQDRDYDAAIKLMDAVGDDQQVDHDYLLYLKGRARHLQKQYDDAIETFDELAKRFPKSDWARRGRFAKAVALARKGAYQKAEEIYRTEATYLLSLDRKQEIADIYIEFAATYFKPPQEDTQPDYKKALEFYQKAVAVGPKLDERVKLELLIAECYQKLDNRDQAIKLYRQFIANHLDHDLVIEARFRLGETYLAANNFVQARRTWEDLLELHKGSSSKRMAEATYKLSLTHQIPTPSSDEALSLGVAALQAFLKKFPKHELAAEAALRLGKSYQHYGRYEDAAKSYRELLANEAYQDTDQLQDAMNQLGETLRLQNKYDEALTTWKKFLSTYPTNQAWSSVQQKIIDTEFAKAEQAYRDKEYDKSRELWQQFLSKYPLDGRNRGILYRFGHIQFVKEKYEDAMTAWRQLISKYPDTNEARRAQFMIGVTLEEKQSKLADALKQYRTLKPGNFHALAQQRIRRLTTKTMQISSERIFRSNETAQIKLKTRNIEQVNVNVYTVDMETYFRKMHLATGIEQLDIALIDPDASFEYKIPDYKEYQHHENDVEIKLPDLEGVSSGVLAVTVTSKTLEATTMVLQSDLDMIVKSSRDELFVFAQNMRTGKPWPQARVLISNGSQVFAEDVTDERGVLHKSYEELKSADDVRVFVIADGHAASNIINLGGLGIAQGLAPRGYIYTDRPVYRPGDLVHVRGILRQVSGDTYNIEEGKEYQVEVFDNRNRLVSEQQVKLSKFGTFHVHFGLPSASSQGDYRIRVFDNDKQNYQGVFQVQDYKLEPVHLTVEAEQTVYYRGEEIKGTIKAAYYYGAPLVGREIRYQLAGGRTFTAKTDKQGEVHFTLPTRDYRESQTLPLGASLPERSLQTSRTFYLSTTGFSLSASTVRSVYLAGEPFELKVNAADAEGQSVQRDLSVKVLRRTITGEQYGEVEEQVLEVKTDAEGVVRQAITLAEGGDYILRVEGVDRFDNIITTETEVHVSDDEDATRLRILANQHTYKVGDQAKIQIHWRDKPTLALITYQGAKILDYDLVQLKQGKNDLVVPMTAKLAPNFDLSVALMTNAIKKADEPSPKRFHEATSAFYVSRELQVQLEIRRKGNQQGAPIPGEEVELVVSTTNPQGKPMSAELSLAMVEQALLHRFSARAPAIEAFFRNAQRQSAVRTTSSIVFRYRPRTNRINRHLLAEAERLEVEREEARSLAILGAAGGDGDHDVANVDMNGLIDLIDQSIEGQSWDEVGDLQSLENNLSLQIQQQQEAMPQVTQGMGFGGFGGRATNRLNEFESVSGMRRGEQVAANAGDFTERLENASANGQVAAINLFSYQNGEINEKAAFRSFLKNRRSAQVLLGDGTVDNIALANVPPEEVEAQVQRILENGGVLLTDNAQQVTGYWNPALVTDEQGQATLTITLPERSTGWRVLAKGITADTLAGEATDELTVKKDLFGQLKVPASVTDGDEAQIVASIHNTIDAAKSVKVLLKVSIGDKTHTETKVIEVDKAGVSELAFDQAFALPPPAENSGEPGAVATVQLTVAADGNDVPADVTTRAIPIRPDGVPVFATRAGTSAGDVLAIVEHPKGMTIETPQLQVIVGPTVERSLLDTVLSPPNWCQSVSDFAESDTVTSDLLAALALQKLLDVTRDGKNPQAESLDDRIRSLISLLVASQNDDGGWSWTGSRATSDRYHTARVVWAISRAREAGYRVGEEGCTRAETYLDSQIAKANVSDYETKAVLLHALAVAGRGDFPLANQLYRNRQALSHAGLAHLSLAFAEMDRKQTASELLSLLTQKYAAAGEANTKGSVGALGWTQSPQELRALYALALEKIEPTGDQLGKQIKWLMEHRVGFRWSPEKATGPAMEAICAWYARTRFEGEKYKLKVFVNDRLAKELDVQVDSRTQTIDVPDDLLNQGQQEVRFELEGRGRFTYQCVLGGFVPTDKLKNTTADWSVERYYQPAPLEVDGRSIPRGFGVLQGSYRSFRNDLTQLPVGQRGQVEVRVVRHNVSSNTRAEQLPYLVVTEPIPAGVAVVENSIKGDFERFDLAPGQITFYLGTRRGGGTIRYEVHGYLAGHYKTVSTLVRNAYMVDQIAVGKNKSLDVLPLGERSQDKYRLTPVELFELGKHHFARGNLTTSGRHLEELVSNWNLKPATYKECVRRLLDVYLKDGPANQVVKYFEIIIEKFPDLEIPFAKLLNVGEAYDKIGEYERSYLVFRATIEASFLRESRVAGFLQSQGEFTRSVDVMSALLREYPPEPYLATAKYALAQRVYAKAPEASADKKLREAKVTRVDLIRQAWAMLEGFLTANPEDPAADQAAFSVANATLDLEFFEQTVEACDRYAKRYPESKYLDSYWYIVGYCHYAMGKHDQAMAMCNKVAEHSRVDARSGRRMESENKWRAIYILGQIQHSLDKPASAIAEYERVKDRFVDARQAIEYFTRKQIELPEVVTVKPNEKAEVELGFRNVAECSTTVYKIDLMKFSLLRRNLGDITKINLSGIRPYHQDVVKLGDGKDYRDRTTQLNLPLKEEGAYLVVCRGANLHTSGLVLVTPLSVEVQEDVNSGRVRATVRDVTNQRYMKDVHVKVIGSRNEEFISGESDLRGVFVADGIQGRSMVLAQADGGRYAFFRGERELGPPPEANDPAAPAAPSEMPAQGKGATKQQLLEGLNRSNYEIQQEQTEQLDSYYDNDVDEGIGGGFGGGFF